MIRFFMLFFLTTFSFLCLLLTYLNFVLISEIKSSENKILKYFNETVNIHKEKTQIISNKKKIKPPKNILLFAYSQIGGIYYVRMGNKK